MQLGVCRNPACNLAASGERVERYPGPGQYCPGCGEQLDSVAPDVPEIALAPEAYEQFRARMTEALFPTERPQRQRQWILFASIAFVFGAILVIAVLRAIPVRSSAVAPVQVCSSSMTGRLADDVVRAYRTSSDLPAARFSLSSSNGCAVRFAVAASAAKDAVIAHDGVVVIVNPANRLSRIGEAELRRILSGTETTWSDESGVGGEIVPIVPDDATDEARALKAFLHGAKLGSGVQRAHGSADIVRVVAAASGRRRIGIVAFSTAAPAKVLALEGKPIPSALSIADHRYPLALDVSVSDDSRQHDTTAAELTQYARSDDAQSVVVRNGLIAKKGF